MRRGDLHGCRAWVGGLTWDWIEGSAVAIHQSRFQDVFSEAQIFDFAPADKYAGPVIWPR